MIQERFSWKEVALLRYDAGLTYVNPTKLQSPAVGLAAGESNRGMLVHRSSKLAMQCFPATFGRKLGWISLAANFFQLIGLNHLWHFISSLPFRPQPSRLLASFCRSCKIEREILIMIQHRRPDTVGICITCIIFRQVYFPGVALICEDFLCCTSLYM